MVKVTMKSENENKLLVFIKEQEKSTYLKEIDYSLVKIGGIFLLDFKFKLRENITEILINKYNALNKFNLKYIFYLICQQNYLIFKYTLTDVITTLIHGYTDNNISNSLYDFLEEIDLLYNTDLSTTFQKGGDINVIL